jgi:hypothetical protein
VTSSTHPTGRAAAGATGREWLARAGLVGRGVLYLLLGVLAFRLAIGLPTDEATDKQGALELLVEQPTGMALLAATSAALAAYAGWRFWRAATLHEDGDAKQWAKRAGNAGIGLLYGATAVAGVSILFDGGDRQSSHSQPSSTHAWTAEVLGWPGGRLVIGTIGAAFAAAAVWNAQRGLRLRFEKHLDSYDISENQRPFIVTVAVVGFVGRAVAFVAIAWFLMHAALEFDPSEPVGLDESLRAIRLESWGPWLIGVVALGLACFGLFSFVEARWRRID